MLPLGIIARTQEYFGGIPVAAEITHHQIIVATALATDATLFYAGLLHDILKPALNFEKTPKGWRWKHLYDVKVNGKKVSVKDILRGVSFPYSLNVDMDELIDLVISHHDRGADEVNPISYVESRRKLGLPLIEATLLPSKDFNKIGLHVCLEAVGLNHPYHYFVLTLIYYGLKHYLNKLYGEIFRSLGLQRLVVDYHFGDADIPRIDYKDGVLSISYFVSSNEFRGLHIRHEYSDDIEFNIIKTNSGAALSFGWSDVLVYMVPYTGSSEVSYRIACVIPGLVKYKNEKVEEDVRVKEEFEAKVSEVLVEVINDLESNIDLKENYRQLIIDYLRGNEKGDYSCLFCGKKTDRKVKLSRSGLLSEKFTDYHRIRGSAEGLEASICPLCHVGFVLEEKFRRQGPSFTIPLAGEPIDVNVSKDFVESFMSSYGQLPINIEEGVILSVLGHSTLQLASNAWYISLLKEIESRPISLPWIKAYVVRAQRDINDLYFRFFISREVLLYPLLVKIRPRAIISSYGGRNKKFVLNTDLLEGHLLWKGEEHDLTEEQLDALRPILREIDKSNIGELRKLYSRVVGLYGLR
ncbi:hypothetical protein [Pyrodictium delaneyi]|uniref:HD domain-containing protein n=1 Tax=Pyrodictium delaneyi TaxID=1273541 RepID=A0A211YP45_9CREN|nr:hypothetical protein [Pyrodictium delaneyi]OWJ54731.1 hypothetical protein Pdsh_03105 [Pyrodictium delaneyi]